MNTKAITTSSPDMEYGFGADDPPKEGRLSPLVLACSKKKPAPLDFNFDAKHDDCTQLVIPSSPVWKPRAHVQKRTSPYIEPLKEAIMRQISSTSKRLDNPRTLLRDNKVIDVNKYLTEGKATSRGEELIRGIGVHRELLRKLFRLNTSIRQFSSHVQHKIHLLTCLGHRLTGSQIIEDGTSPGISSSLYTEYNFLNSPLTVAGKRLSQASLLLEFSGKEKEKDSFLELAVRSWSRVPSLCLGTQIEKREYMGFMLRAYQAIIGSLLFVADPKMLTIEDSLIIKELIVLLQEEVVSSITKDWIHDSRGAVTITHQLFVLSVLDLSRTWLPVFCGSSEGLIAQIKFIDRLFSRITRPGRGRVPVWRSFASITHLNLPDVLNPSEEKKKDINFVYDCSKGLPRRVLVGPVSLYRNVIEARTDHVMSLGIRESMKAVIKDKETTGSYGLEVDRLERRIATIVNKYYSPLMSTKGLMQYGIETSVNDRSELDVEDSDPSKVQKKKNCLSLHIKTEDSNVDQKEYYNPVGRPNYINPRKINNDVRNCKINEQIQRSDSAKKYPSLDMDELPQPLKHTGNNLLKSFHDILGKRLE